MHQENHEEQAKGLARKYNLIMTDGSHFHGEYEEKPVLIGSKSPGMEILDELMESILVDGLQVCFFLLEKGYKKDSFKSNNYVAECSK